jgi:hypothetical protein
MSASCRSTQTSCGAAATGCAQAPGRGQPNRPLSSRRLKPARAAQISGDGFYRPDTKLAFSAPVGAFAGIFLLLSAIDHLFVAVSRVGGAYTDVGHRDNVGGAAAQ